MKTLKFCFKTCVARKFVDDDDDDEETERDKQVLLRLHGCKNIVFSDISSASSRLHGCQIHDKVKRHITAKFQK